jgi:Flp pilus assembly protein TadG
MCVRCIERQRSGERGSIIIMTAIFALLLLLMVGMCIDISRIYAVRAELQNAADAAALAATRELNSGDTGIVKAVNAAMNVIVNTQGIRAKTNVGILSVEFAENLDDDPYLNDTDAKLNPENIRFVRVTTQATSTNILFASSALGLSHTESRVAVAGTSVGLSGICDFFPAAIALLDADQTTTVFDPPAVNTSLTLTFNQGTGNEAIINDKEFIILEVPDINGNGTGETALLTAGLKNYCKSLGDNIPMTPSSNQNNGPRNSGDGINTRFGVYANGYGNGLQPGVFPPDTNVTENISYSDYVNGDPPGNTRRRIVAPIILPNGPPPLQASYPAYTTNIQDWGIFFITKKVPVPQGNCSNTPGCGSLLVEYVGKANVSASGDPTCTSGLTTPVLYR